MIIKGFMAFAFFHHAKEIENVSKFGINSGQNEKEVLFLANTKFNILEIICENEITIITMEEN